MIRPARAPSRKKPERLPVMAAHVRGLVRARPHGEVRPTSQRPRERLCPARRNGSSRPTSIQIRVDPNGQACRAAPITSWRAKSSASSKAPAGVSPPVSHSAGAWPPLRRTGPGCSRATSSAPKPPIEKPSTATRRPSRAEPPHGCRDRLLDEVAAPRAIAPVVPVALRRHRRGAAGSARAARAASAPRRARARKTNSRGHRDPRGRAGARAAAGGRQSGRQSA